jgi:flagellin-like hook-associated protein FlgL
MGLNDISLTAGMRSNLLSLQTTTTLLDRTQSRLATGKKVNTALDNPVNFFAAQNHTQRAGDLQSRKDGMAEAVQSVQASNKGITGITSLIEAARGLTQSARSGDNTSRTNLATQFNLIRTQIDGLATDSGYKGTNFLKSGTLNVLFNENGGSLLTISGFDATAGGLTITAVGAATTTGVTLAAQSAGTAVTTSVTTIHTGFRDTTSAVAGAISTGTFFINNAAKVTGVTISGSALAITFTDLANTTGTTYTGLTTQAGASGYQVNAVYANGTLVSTSDYTLSGAGGNVNVNFVSGLVGNYANVTTGALFSISYDVTVQAHLSGANSAAPANLALYNLATGDIGSGANLASLSGGIQVFVSGQYVAQSNYTITGNTIVFSGTAIPSSTSGSVSYAYNTGYSAVNGANSISTSNFTGLTLGATQYISGVLVNGTAATTGYTVSGNQITFNVGLAAGSAVTYSILTPGAGGWISDAGIDTSVAQLDAALSTLRSQAASLASNLNVVSTRQDFTDGMINTLLKGADNLTLADMNEEGANMLMLQTRQQLSTTSLKMASDAAQAVLRLF